MQQPEPAHHPNGASAPLGVVVIGRNEGARLQRCLESLLTAADRIVYVDSGSRDGSVSLGRSLGARVVELDLTTPFTAARARNQGFWTLLEWHPELQYVFFVDGDCEVVPGWITEAIRNLEANDDVAVVCGWRRERYPERSVYNLLCEIEWTNLPIGDVKACGGDAVMRVAAVREVNGYRPDLICGEEPELCVRLRKAGWRIWRVDHDMTVHDAALYHLGQWWKRAVRAGYAYAIGAHLHGEPPERHWVQESRRAWIWGAGVPSAILLASLVFGWRSLLLIAVYPLQFLRLMFRGKRSRRENFWHAAAMVVCKFPEVVGQFKFLTDKLLRVRSGIIEYK